MHDNTSFRVLVSWKLVMRIETCVHDITFWIGILSACHVLVPTSGGSNLNPLAEMYGKNGPFVQMTMDSTIIANNGVD